MWQLNNLFMIYLFFALPFIGLGIIFLILDTKTQCTRYRYKDQNRDHLIKIYKDIYKLVGINLLIVHPILMLCSSYFVKIRTDPFNLMEGLTMVLSLTFCVLVYDVIFWFLHKLLHTGYFYEKIHYKHHELRTTVGIGGIYTHPIEYMMSNFLPAFVGAYLFRHHIYSICVLLTLSGGGAVITHSGYSGTHVIHHWVRNCHFGVFGAMDKLMGTDNNV